MAKIACPHEDEWTAYLIGNLPTARQEELADHLESCSLCPPVVGKLLPSAKDDLIAALRQSNKSNPLSDEPELKQVTARLEQLLVIRQRGTGRGPRESPLPPGVVPVLGSRDTLPVHVDQIDYRRSTASSLDLNAGDDNRQTAEVHIPRVDDRRTTSPVLEREGDENRFFLSLVRPKTWPQLQSLPPASRVPFVLGLIAVVALVVAAIVVLVLQD